MCVCVTSASVVVKEVRSSRGLGQLMGMARKRTRAQALQSAEHQKESCVAYVETRTDS